MYCMPLWQARKAFTDVITKYEQDSLIKTMGTEITLEKADKNQQNIDFKAQLKTEKERNQVLVEENLNKDSVAGTYKQEAEANNQLAKKERKGKIVAIFGWTLSDIALIAVIISLL